LKAKLRRLRKRAATKIPHRCRICRASGKDRLTGRHDNNDHRVTVGVAGFIRLDGRMLQSALLRWFWVAAGLALLLPVRVAAANDATPPLKSSPTFGSRTDNPDGSASLTMGRSLPTGWETKVGADVSLSAPASPVPSDNLVRGVTPEPSSGAIWGSLTMPGLSPLGFDKTAVDARYDSGNDEGRLGATLSRTVPLSRNLSVALQNSYSVTQTLGPVSPAISAVPWAADATPTTPVEGPSPVWAAAESVRLNFKPSGTTLSASGGTSTGDALWHNKFSLEQTLFGPVKVTTSLEDAGMSTSQKSITAGFKHVW
jgi:hypothetical protein